MRAPAIRLLLAASMLAAATPLPATAQFGLPGISTPRLRGTPSVPNPGRGIGLGPVTRVFPIMPMGRGMRTFGVLGAVVFGGVILGRLSRRDGVEVTRRTKVMLNRDRDREVVETYQTRDGGNQVTITAAPVQRVSDIKDDPVLQQTADTAKQVSTESQKQAKGKKGKEPQLESEFLKVDALPPETECRRVTTELEIKAKKGAKETGDSKASNTSILCQTSGGEWKPASI